MDANHVQEESKHLVEKLSSIEIADSFYAVNKYFDSNARIVHGPAAVTGVSRVKKILSLETYTRDGNAKTIKGPTYDAQKGVIKFQSQVNYKSPELPAFIPFAKSFSGHKSSAVYNWRIFVAPNNDEEGDGGAKGQKLFVTKWEEDKDGRAFAEALFLTIMTPILTFVVLAVSTYLTFYDTHKHESLGKFIMSAAEELVTGIWMFLLAETGKRQAAAEKWRDEKLPQIKGMYDQAYNSAWDTATKVQMDLENRAKSAGIPVDDYKKQATAAIADLAENVEARAKAAGVPVEEYKKQAEAIIEDLKKKAGELGEWAQQNGQQAIKQAEQTGSKVKESAQQTGSQVKERAHQAGSKAKETAHQTANDVSQDSETHPAPIDSSSSTATTAPAARTEEEILADFAITPHTPLGGHDPTATHAPSFAEAAKI